MNKNYQAGRRAEYACAKRWEAKGYAAARSAGSHGIWDVCAVRPRTPVALIQCKVVGDVATANRMLKQFRENPPILPDSRYHLVLEVKVKGSNEILSVVV